MRLPSFEGLAFTNDNKRALLSSNRTGIHKLYSINWQDGRLKQLSSSFDRPVSPISWFPKDNRVLFSADNEGNENTHVYVLEETGQAIDLTPGHNTRAKFISWANDYESFVIESNERNSNFNDLYVVNVDDLSKRLLFMNELGWSAVKVSRDLKWAAALRPVSNSEFHILLIDLINPEQSPHLITRNASAESDPSIMNFSPNSSYLYYQAIESGDYAATWAFNIPEKDSVKIVSKDQDINYFRHSPTGQYEIIQHNDINEYVERIRHSRKDLSQRQIEVGSDIRTVRFSADDSRALVTTFNPQAPMDVYLVDLHSGARKQVIKTLNKNISKEHMVVGKVVFYESFDDLKIPAVLYKPKLASMDAPVPVILWLHGGPEGTSRRGYYPHIQYLVNRGFAVFAPNFRGSGGFGKTFMSLNDKDHGGGDLQDIFYAAKYLETLPWIRSNAMVVMGPSYGGFLTLAALISEPNMFAAGISEYGVADWVHLLANLPSFMEGQRKSFF